MWLSLTGSRSKLTSDPHGERRRLAIKVPFFTHVSPSLSILMMQLANLDRNFSGGHGQLRLALFKFLSKHQALTFSARLATRQYFRNFHEIINCHQTHLIHPTYLSGSPLPQPTFNLTTSKPLTLSSQPLRDAHQLPRRDLVAAHRRRLRPPRKGTRLLQTDDLAHEMPHPRRKEYLRKSTSSASNLPPRLFVH